MKTLTELQQTSKIDLIFQEDYQYISDDFNANLVCSYNHNNNLDGIDELYAASEDRILAKIGKYHSVDISTLKQTEETAKSIINDDDISIHDLELENKNHKKYVSHAAFNSDVEKLDFVMAWSLTGLFFLLFVLTAFTEISLAKFFLEYTLDLEGGDGILGKVGNLVYVIGSLPALIMCMGFFHKENILSLKWIIRLELVWMMMYAGTLIVFGEVAPSQALTNLLASAAGWDFDIRSITGFLMVITQAILLTAVGHYFTSQASKRFVSTRLNKISINPIWEALNKQIEELTNKVNLLHSICGTVKGKLEKIEEHKKEVLALNKLSINRHLQLFECIDNDINKLRDDIKINEEKYRKLRKNLSVTLDNKMKYLDPLITENKSINYQEKI